MYKIVKNLSAIFLIGFVALGITINNSPVNNTSDQVSKSTMTKIFLATENNQEVYYNPQTINVSHVATSNTSLNFDNEYMFKADVYQDNNLIKSINLFKITNNDNKIVDVDGNSSFTTNLDISQDNLNLPNGNYEVILTTNGKNKEGYISPVNLKVHYNTVVTYIKARGEVPQGKMPITLYYPTKDYKVKELIGITKFVDKNSKPLNTLITNLKLSPNNLSGISVLPPVGSINYVHIDKKYSNLVYVDLPPSDDIYTLDNDKSKAAMNSFIKSLTRTSNYDFIIKNTNLSGFDKVKFLVDYNKADKFFRDVDISNSIKYTWENKAYLSYNSGERYYLVDVDINMDNLTINEKVAKIFEVLKSGTENLGNTIPENVNLLDFKLSGDTITLNFNKEFTTSYNNEINKQSMMLDSILLSFSSIENIKYITVLVENNIVNNFGKNDISIPLKAPEYINPEN